MSRNKKKVEGKNQDTGLSTPPHPCCDMCTLTYTHRNVCAYTYMYTYTKPNRTEVWKTTSFSRGLSFLSPTFPCCSRMGNVYVQMVGHLVSHLRHLSTGLWGCFQRGKAHPEYDSPVNWDPGRNKRGKEPVERLCSPVLSSRAVGPVSSCLVLLLTRLPRPCWTVPSNYEPNKPSPWSN